MPGLIGSQGVRPGALNMSRVFRALRYRTEQAQYVVYNRPAIYKTDDYGVPSGTVGSPELLLPDLQAIVRPALTADYSQERLGSNIIGAARIYTPNITTIKNYDNFNQNNNGNFNEIEGWDSLITNYRTIFDVPTATTKNILEADRLRLKIKTNFTTTLTSLVLTNITPKTLTYTPTALTIPSGEWLTIDVPFISGTTSSSIYRDGTRYNVVVAEEGGWDYEDNMNLVQLNYTGYGAVTDTIQVKELEFYKSVSWHVHSLKDMTDGYLIFNCVRTTGRYDSRRRAEE